MNKKSIKVGILYTLGNLFNKGIAFITIPIYTRILTTYDYGIVNTYTSWVGIVSIIIGMALHMSIRTAFIDYKEDIDDFVSTIFYFNILIFMIFFIVFFFMLNIFRININYVLVILCLIQGFATSLIEDYSMYLMMKIEYKWRTFLLVIPNLIINIISIFIIYCILDSHKYLGKIIPSSFITLIFAIIITFIVFKRGKFSLNKKFVIYALNISLPLILHGLALNILSQSDRIMLTNLVGASETGIYSLTYNLSMVAMVFISSIEGVWIPWFMKKMNEKNVSEINEKFKLYLDFMTVIVGCIILVSPEVLKILAPKEYWAGDKIIPPIILSSYVIFLYTNYVNIEHFYKKTKFIALNTIIAASTNIILNLIFIPKYKSTAASITTIISYLISLILHYTYSRKLEENIFPLILYIIPILSIICIVVSYYIFLYKFTIRLFLVTTICLIYIIKILVNKDKLIIK